VTAGAGIAHHEVDVGSGLTIHVADSGSGPPVVLLHGFTGSTETWAPLRAELSVEYRAIAVDQPGHGRSASPGDPARYRLDRFAADLGTVLDSIEIDRATVIGYSMGGRAALRFALTHPERVAGLVLESASPGIADEKQRRERRAADTALADRIERDGVSAFIEYWESLSLWDTQRALTASARDGLHRQRLLNDPIGLANSLRGAGAAEDAYMLDAATAITAPTLVIAGALDSKYVELGKLLQRSIPASRLEIIPDSGHTTHLEQPRAFASVMLAFLESIASNGNRWA
jgi:2-succinyl-6-hydroxy-2,4-cyclohexadiene-1-carboxylate synthase